MTTRKQKIVELKQRKADEYEKFKEKLGRYKVKETSTHKERQLKLLREIQRLENLEKAREHKLENQRKFLLGGAALRLVKTDQATWTEVKEWLKLDSFLTRDPDRAKFNLPPLAPENQPEGSAEQGHPDPHHPDGKTG